MIRNFRATHVFAAAFLFFAATGCALVDSSDGGYSVLFSVEHDRYEPDISSGTRVEMDFLIATELENDGDEDVVLVGCINPSRPVLQKRLDGIWTTVYAVPEPECISPPWFIEPGEIHRDTLQVQAILDPEVVPVVRWDSGIPVDGFYRLERMVYTDQVVDQFPSNLLPLEQRVSQTFEIRTQQALSLR